MAKITYKSSIPNDKPLWLLKLQLAVSQLDATGLKGNEQDFRNLKSFIDAEIRSLMEKGDIRRSFVETELRHDEGKTVIHIFRNQMMVQTYYYYIE